MIINVSDLEFIMAGKPINNLFNNSLFNLQDGTQIYAGDTVRFYIEGQIFPFSGTVQNINGLKVGCFSQLLNKWRYWHIVQNKKE